MPAMKKKEEKAAPHELWPDSGRLAAIAGRQEGQKGQREGQERQKGRGPYGRDRSWKRPGWSLDIFDMSYSQDPPSLIQQKVLPSLLKGRQEGQERQERRQKGARNARVSSACFLCETTTLFLSRIARRKRRTLSSWMPRRSSRHVQAGRICYSRSSQVHACSCSTVLCC